MSFFISPFRLVWQHWNILWQTTLNDIKLRYSGSLFGLFWLLFQPLLFLGAYAMVYLFVFKVRFALFSADEYVVVIFCGLIPFLGFAEVLGVGTMAITSNVSLIKNTLFPIDLIPIKALLVSQTTQFVGMLLLLGAVVTVGHISVYAFWLPLLWFLQLMFMMGVVWLLSSLNVYMKDLQYIIGTLVLFLMMVSPIAYTVEMVPENLRHLLWYNPLSHMIISYQQILMQGSPPGWHFWCFAAIAVVAFYAGYFVFSRLKKVFIDNM